MVNVDAVLLFEKAVRELDVACALKTLLAQRHGLQVEIVQQNYGYPDAFRTFRPRVVILPFCYQERSHNLYLLRWPQAIYFNLSWEQLFYPGNEKAKTPRGEFAVRHVIHHAWSDFYADLLKQQGVPAAHIFVNGQPAYQLYQPPYCNFFRSRSELAVTYSLDTQRRWLFFPENYNWAFYTPAMLTQMINDGQPAHQVQAMRDFSCQSFETVMRWCARLADEDGLEVILRPRPSTPVDEFQQRVTQVVGQLPARLHILQTESVRDWILASDVVASSYSTSLIEASLAHRPVFMIEPFPLPEALRQSWYNYLPRLTQVDDFRLRCRTAEATLAGQALGDWARQNLLKRGDPIANLVDYVARLIHGHITRPPRPRWQTIALEPKRLGAQAKMLLHWVRWLRVQALWPPFFNTIEAEYRADMQAAAQLPARLTRWAQVLAEFHQSSSRKQPY